MVDKLLGGSKFPWSAQYCRLRAECVVEYGLKDERYWRTIGLVEHIEIGLSEDEIYRLAEHKSLKGQSNEIFTSDFFTDGLLPSPLLGI